MTDIPLCNDCIHYISRFPGYCGRDPAEVKKCGAERTYGYGGKCGFLGRLFEPARAPASPDTETKHGARQ